MILISESLLFRSAGFRIINRGTCSPESKGNCGESFRELTFIDEAKKKIRDEL
jgi:hypothetical protein